MASFMRAVAVARDGQTTDMSGNLDIGDGGGGGIRVMIQTDVLVIVQVLLIRVGRHPVCTMFDNNFILSL